ncbi:MAG TPA: glycosyltransferase [Thermoplasmata archaeon]
MKIAMFTDSYRPTVDGAVVALEMVSTGLERRGHEILIIAPQMGDKNTYRWPVHYLPSREFKKYPGYRYVVSPSDVMDFVRKQKVDVIHCHGLASMAVLSLAASRALRIPHVLTFHTMANEAVKYHSPLPLPEDLMVRLTWIYLRNLLKRPEVVVVPTSPVREELVQNGARMKACEVVPTGVDCDRFSPERYDKDFVARFGFKGKRVLLHVGRLSLEKRMEVVLKAMAALRQEEPDLRLLVVGKGPAEEHYKSMANSLGLKDRVVFAGFLPDDALPAAYASCEALIIASTFETQGLVVLEALASGTPVIGMRSRAIPEFVKEGKNGCLFDADSCPEAIRRCLSRGDTMMINAVSSAREFSIDACTARLESVYGQAARIHSNQTTKR